MRVVTEFEFSQELRKKLSHLVLDGGMFILGPGRSGAIASAYASHLLGIPFIPYGAKPPKELGRALIIDTAISSGKTIRRAIKKYKEYNPLWVTIYEEPPRVKFWYEEKELKNEYL